MKKLFLSLAVAFVCLASVCAQSKLSNWTALMLEQQKQMTQKEMLLSPMGKMIKMDNGLQMVQCYVHFNGEIDEEVLAMYGAQLRVRFDELNIATASVPMTALEALSENEKVTLVEVAQTAEIKLDKARAASFADPAHAGQAPLTHAYTGNGVLVGVVDQELQYGHPAFWNEAHNRFRIKSVWDQSGTSDHPSGFSYGSEYPDSASILRKAYDVSSMYASSGHATHVMGIAAGADHTLNYYGVAQQSDLIFVSCPGSIETGIPEGIKYIFGKATELGKPCVVNVSMGGYTGPHDGTSTESRIIDGLVGPGRIVCASAGNEGYDKIHWAKALTPTDTVGKTMYNPSGESQISQYDYCPIDIWGDTNVTYKIRFFVYDRDSAVNRYESQWYDACPEYRQSYSINETRSVYSSNDLNISVSLSTEVYQYNNRGNVSAIAYLRAMPNRCAFGFEVKSDTNCTVHAFTRDDFGAFTSYGKTKKGFTDGDYDITVCEPSGVTKKVVSVGAYVTNNQGSGTVGARALFSSMGPTVDGRIKPDVSAPGQTLMSAYPDYSKISEGRGPSTSVGGKTYYYGYMQGTSMSSPYAAGTIALWLEANPNLDYDDIIDVFKHTCISDNYCGALPNNSWGWGKINTYVGLLYILGYTQAVENVDKPSVLAVYEDGNSDIFKIGFAKLMNDLTVRVSDMSGRIVYTSAEGDVLAGQEISVDLSNMTPGMYIINVGGENYKVLR